MRILSVFILLIFVFVYGIHAQSVLTPEPYYNQNNSTSSPQSENRRNDGRNIDDQWDHLTINSDSRINLLLEIQQEESIRKGGMDGYRIQIYQGTKDEAYQLKSKFLSLYPKFPENEVYVKFQTPDFKVRIGDFRTRSEAINLKYKIIRNFPSPLIVEDIINFPDIDQ